MDKQMKPEMQNVEKKELRVYDTENEYVIYVPSEVIPVFDSIFEKMKQAQQQFIAVAEAMKPIEN